MSQKRSLTGFLVASLGLAAGLAVVSPDVASAGDVCDKYKNADVKAFCNTKKEGKDAAAMTKIIDSAMKDAVKKAKKDGKAIECKTCHEDGADKKLKSDADFSQLKAYF